MEELIVDGNSCNNEMFTVLNLSSFVKLKSLEVGDYSFAYVEELKLIGLKMLERVVIGKHCFRKSDDNGRNYLFYLKDCEQLKELKIGRYSFSFFTVCEIANVPSLEVIEVSDNFFFAKQFELKSDVDGMK